MSTWYLVGQLTKRVDLPSRIRETARRLGCLQEIDSIRLEKSWGRVKAGNGVYCAIGFADPRPHGGATVPELPFDAEQFAERLGFRLIAPGDFSRSVLPEAQAVNWTQESLASGDPIVHIERAPPPDPADVELARDVQARATGTAESQETSLGFDRLMAWLSVQVSGTWPQFADACRSLGLDASTKAGDVLGRLQLLGHLEVSADGGRWVVTPPVIVGDVHGGWFLCGQRCDRMLEELATILPIEHHPQHGGPTVVTLAPSAEQLETRQVTIGALQIPLIGDACRQIAAQFPTWDLWYANMRNSYHPDLAATEAVERVAVDGQAVIVRPESINGKLTVGEGLYRLTFRHGYTTVVRAYCDGSGAWTRCDWYGMSYLAQRSSGLRAFCCDSDVIIPVDQPWPRLYERPLVLATGKLPSWVPGKGRLFAAASDIARSLAPKLEIAIENISAEGASS
jgi:hypothetical protein